MAYDVTYNADFNILATITAPLFKSTDPNIKLDTNLGTRYRKDNNSER